MGREQSKLVEKWKARDDFAGSSDDTLQLVADAVVRQRRRRKVKLRKERLRTEKLDEAAREIAGHLRLVDPVSSDGALLLVARKFAAELLGAAAP